MISNRKQKTENNGEYRKKFDAGRKTRNQNHAVGEGKRASGTNFKECQKSLLALFNNTNTPYTIFLKY